MSLEDCIKDHAAAIRELAAAILGTASATRITVGHGPKIKGTITEPTDAQIDAEIDAADKKAIGNAIAEVKGTTKAEAAKNQEALEAERELEKDVAKVEAAAKNAASAAGTATAAADTQTTAGAADTATAEAQTSYDYAKDVAPVLTKVAQKSRDNLVALLAKFGAKRGNELKADDYAAVLADANKLLAG